MAKKGKEFNRENVIQTLRNHFGLNWDDRAKELNKLDNPDTYTGEQLRSYCRRDSNSDWYSEFKRKKGSHIALTNEMHRNPNNTISKEIIINRKDGKLYTEKEIGSVILRQFGTAKKPDPYEIKNGWTTNRKVIQLVEYNAERPVAVYEV